MTVKGRMVHDPEEKKSILDFVSGMLHAMNMPPIMTGALEHSLHIVDDTEEKGVKYFIVACPHEDEPTVWIADES